MKTALRHILCVIYALLSVFCMNGQTLNQYELLCGECLDLKERVNSGISVSRIEASGTIERFVEMNAEIKKTTGSMTEAERTRFEAINRWFSTGIRPAVLDHIPMYAISPVAVRLLEVPYDRSFAFAPEEGDPAEAPLTEEIKDLKTFLLATLSLPQTSYGAMLGLQYGNWGGYIRFSSSFRRSSPDYTCTSNGIISNGSGAGMPFWPGGDSLTSDMKASAGALYGPLGWLSIYGGLGYGCSYLDWNDIDGNWARVEDLSFKGLAAEAGILASWKIMTLGLGISTISFQTVSFDISLGVSF